MCHLKLYQSHCSKFHQTKKMSSTLIKAFVLLLQAMKPTLTQSKPRYHDILLLTEQESGLRFCLTCSKLLPLDKFNPNKRKFTCNKHERAYKCSIALGTQDKRTFNSMRCRARSDMLMFGHKKMVLSRLQLMSLLTEHQVQNFSQYCVIPRRPDEILTLDNAVVVGTLQRRYVVGRWKRTRNPDQYECDLALLLSKSND